MDKTLKAILALVLRSTCFLVLIFVIVSMSDKPEKATPQLVFNSALIMGILWQCANREEE